MRALVHRPSFRASTLSPLAAFAALLLIFGVYVPDLFYTRANILAILNENAVAAIVACGLTIVLVAGEFDLSIGSVMSFCGALSFGMASGGMPTGLAVFISLLVGGGVGVLNGVLVTAFRVPALIATLAMGSLLDGFTLYYTGGETLFAGIPHSYLSLGQGTVGGIQVPVFILFGVGVFLVVFLTRAITGRQIEAVGAGRAAAAVSGVRVDRVRIVAFVVSGLLASLAGTLSSATSGSVDPLFGSAFLLPAFAAAFLGSVTLREGEFHIGGTVFGAYLVAAGSAGFLMLGAPFYTQEIFSGGVLILATAGSRLAAGRSGLSRATVRRVVRVLRLREAGENA